MFQCYPLIYWQRINHFYCGICAIPGAIISVLTLMINYPTPPVCFLLLLSDMAQARLQ
jgi:hypothetical protein